MNKIVNLGIKTFLTICFIVALIGFAVSTVLSFRFYTAMAVTGLSVILWACFALVLQFGVPIYAIISKIKPQISNKLIFGLLVLLSVFASTGALEGKRQSSVINSQEYTSLSERENNYSEKINSIESQRTRDIQAAERAYKNAIASANAMPENYVTRRQKAIEKANSDYQNTLKRINDRYDKKENDYVNQQNKIRDDKEQAGKNSTGYNTLFAKIAGLFGLEVSTVSTIIEFIVGLLFELVYSILFVISIPKALLFHIMYRISEQMDFEFAENYSSEISLKPSEISGNRSESWDNPISDSGLHLAKLHPEAPISLESYIKNAYSETESRNNGLKLLGRDSIIEKSGFERNAADNCLNFLRRNNFVRIIGNTTYTDYDNPKQMIEAIRDSNGNLVGV